jgi:hypothetical protein
MDGEGLVVQDALGMEARGLERFEDRRGGSVRGGGGVLEHGRVNLGDPAIGSIP